MNSSDITKFQQCIFNSINHTGFAVELNNENIPPNKLTYSVGPANAFWNLLNAQGTYNQFQNNIWYHIVFVKSGTLYSLYQNNQFDGSSVVSASTGYNQSVGIRFGSIGGMEFFKGKLDDFGAWNRALTQQEITNLYNSCSTPLTSEFSAAACEQYQLPWGGTPVTISDDYLHTYQTASGCDSIVTAHITINHAVAGASFNANGISTYTLPWGEQVTSSGYYTHLYQNVNGCDSLVTAYVVINTPPNSGNPNVGINMENPQRSLHVNDAMRIEPRNTPLNNPTKGDLYFDGVLNKLRVYDGTTWQNCW